tara:strand:+ start:531 stop:971 length:441 start_codon:yes stop_codon:yes gene_type:complete
MSGIINSAGSRSGVIGTTEIDYEEGTWTASVSTGAGSGSQTGYYTKIGQVVFIELHTKGTNITGACSAIAGLPFPADNTDTHTTGGVISSDESCPISLGNGTSKANVYCKVEGSILYIEQDAAAFEISFGSAQYQRYDFNINYRVA